MKKILKLLLIPSLILAYPGAELFCSNGYNVIFISIDVLRADHLSCYGYPRATSPNIDRLASRGIIFREHISQSNSTLPSHISMFTSLDPAVHGVMIPLKDILDEKITTLPEILRKEGYKTVLFAQMNPHFHPHSGLGRGYDETYDRLDDYYHGSGPPLFEWIRENREEDFFLCIYSLKLHFPYIPAEATRGRFNTGRPSFIDAQIFNKRIFDILKSKFRADRPFIEKMFGKDFVSENEDIFTGGFGPDYYLLEQRGYDHNYEAWVRVYGQVVEEYNTGQTEESTAVLTALYDEVILDIDAFIGELIDTLERLEEMENTIIVITSGVGEELGEHALVAAHGQKLYEEEIRVPFIMICPGIGPGKVDSLSQTIDIMPTILDVLDIKGPEYMQGNSLLALMRGEKTGAESRDALVYGSASALRTERWKLISGKSLELYDIKKDPGEKKELYLEEPGTVNRLAERLKERIMDSKRLRKEIIGR